uniref:Semaphorin-1A n=1 Tax=Oryzias latipes TaxID=8090 RepID=A0A3P9L874_ORYLA
MNKGAMHPLLSLCVFSLLLPTVALEEDLPPISRPRRFVPYGGNNALLFQEEGVFNYSTMLVREDLNLLVVGSREAVFALDLKNVSKKHASVNWKVPLKKVNECKNKGKNPETECKNYIRVLHKKNNGKMYVCGTNAFDPECDILSYTNGTLTLAGTGEDGKTKCPFDPYQKHASLMVDDSLYSATSVNFLGTEPIFARSSPPMRTEFTNFWLNEPSFVSMAQIPEGKGSKEGDDDKVYLFFREIAVEFDYQNKMVVSRVARVCKGDIGGERTLQKKWTSFLKTRIDCPVLELQLPYLIQDTYLWCDPMQDWKGCIFYAIFTPQIRGTSDLSAVCAYKVSEMSKVFSEGKYKSPVPIETSFIKWVTFSGEVPFPRPGACINDEARKAEITNTMLLPDRTLQFVKEKPLMDEAIQPIGGRPVLVGKGAPFTRIVVSQVQPADEEPYHVMFIGTEAGTLLKAVNYNEEAFIIEEVKLFEQSGPIKILKTFKDKLYAGSDFGVVQISPANCERSPTCEDCVLARDPYCGWDGTDGKCVSFSDSKRKLIQSLKEGNASQCPKTDPKNPVELFIMQGGNMRLDCRSATQLAEVHWEKERLALSPSAHFHLLEDALLILNASESESGHYRCITVEKSKTSIHNSTVIEYQVQIYLPRSEINPLAQTSGPSVTGLQTTLAFFVIAFLALLAWNFYKSHIPLPCNTKKKNVEPQQNQDQEAPAAAAVEKKPLMSEPQNNTSNNNHAAAVNARSDADEEAAPKPRLSTLQFIDDESEA